MVTVVELRTRWLAINEWGDVIGVWYRPGHDLAYVCLVVALMAEFIREVG